MFRILVVDDVADQVMVTGRPLMNEFEILVATSGIDALEVIASQQPDLVLLDVQMPDMDGFQVLERMQATPQWSGIPVILISADEREDTRLQAIACGAFDLLSKPVDVLRLRSRVHAALGRSPGIER